ncbi:anti-phage defense-associated sirtuin Dsr2 [Candidatus Latescibacterota bacterium]
MGNTETNIEIPDSIKIYIDEIARRLWSGHAAIMVGAGFSKNARSINPTTGSFPDWAQLGNSFYKILYGSSPPQDQHYLNPLKLAGEVQAAFGRSSLDQLIRTKIPDKNFEPSDLHTKLLRLPWTDVFTTNYDTLLERACMSVTDQKYDIVINKEDLIFSKKPRIIKLHGSFPSDRPFIITEEDYRKYPNDFAPFVNTVQQALIENTLCLIGFSGDDPNFLEWIGWIRDNLGKENSPKLYLVGIFKLSDAQKKLLEQRNIVVINLSKCPSIDDTDFEAAFHWFIDYLRSVKEDDPLEWPAKHSELSPKSDSDIIPQIEVITAKWKEQRMSYPNWLICPEDRRGAIWTFTNNWAVGNLLSNKFVPPLDIDFIYELNWRLECCLYPIFNHLITDYEDIINRYNPFSDSLPEFDAEITDIDEKYKELDWNKIKKQWLELHFAVLRFFREEGFLDKWERIDKRIEVLKQELSPELLARWNYERTLFALFSLNLKELESSLYSWPNNESLPLWEAKRAGLLAEMGKVKESETILKKSLQTIRSQLNLNPVTNDFTWVSQESYIMQLLKYVKESINFTQRRYIENEKLRQQYNNRWNALKEYKCDPWIELKLFESLLIKESINKPIKREIMSFDVGRVTIEHSFGGTNKDLFAAYTFLRFCEEISIPFRVTCMTFGKEGAQGAIKRIANYSPYWALSAFIRFGDEKLADNIFDRLSIAQMTIQQVDQLIVKYLNALDEANSYIEKGDPFLDRNLGIQFACVIPEILSRLCLKCSSESLDRLLEFVIYIYNSETKHKAKYKGVANLVERLIKSWSKDDIIKYFPKLIDIPILDNLHVLVEKEYPEPFAFVQSYKNINISEFIKINSKTFKLLIKKSKSTSYQERKRATFRLIRFYEFGLLNSTQEKAFGIALWIHTVKNTGFPADVDFYNFAFINLPHPSTVNPLNLFREYISKTAFLVQKDTKEKGIRIIDGNIPICKEILGGTKRFYSKKEIEGIEWTQDELIILFDKLYYWWQADKDYLKDKHDEALWGNTKNEFLARFENLVNILAIVILPRLSPDIDDKTKDKIALLLSEFDEYGLPSTSAKASSLTVFPGKIEKVLSEIQNKAISSELKEVIKAFEGIFFLITLKMKNKIPNIPNNILSPIIQCINWRCNPGLIPAINQLKIIITNIPDAITEKEMSSVLFGLDFLIHETELFSENSHIEKDNRLHCRIIAASLAYKLYQWFINKDKAIPEEIKKWGKICLSKDEFAEIRNQWKR